MREFRRLIFVWLLFCTIITVPFCAAAESNRSASDVHEPAGKNVVVHWNRIAVELVASDPGPLLDVRVLAILHASIHDSLNGIQRRYQPYTADLSSPAASIEAAVAAAARDILIHLSPKNTDKIEEAYRAALSQIPDGPPKDQGVTLGRNCAQANLARRANDGIGTINEPAYVPTGEPGDYDFTPPFDQPPLGPAAFYPGFGRMKTFVIDLEKHRLQGPDSIRSKSYAHDLNRLSSIGRLDSSVRTEDQTKIAFFWFEEFPIWNQIADTIILQRNLDNWEAARILALLNFAATDGVIACMEAKYHYRFWRPYTAIRRADEDANPDTEADKDWQPLFSPSSDEIPPAFFIPPIPEYPSLAAVSSGAIGEVLIRNFGDRVSFSATSPRLPDVSRRFKKISDAAKEARLSRLYGGIHFLHSIEDGYRQGKGIGVAVSRMLTRVHP